MPTRDGDIKTNDPWTLKSKNASKRRDLVTEQKAATSQIASKNPGSTDKERPHVGLINRNKSTAQKDMNTERQPKSQVANRNPGSGSDDLFASKSVNTGAARKNDAARLEHPEARINSGKTKVKTYPAGRNRGRNYKA